MRVVDRIIEFLEELYTSRSSELVMSLSETSGASLPIPRTRSSVVV